MVLWDRAWPRRLTMRLRSPAGRHEVLAAAPYETDRRL